MEPFTIASLVLLAIGGPAIYGLRHKLGKLLFGRKVAVIGHRKSGKTTFFRYLRQEQSSSSYAPTEHAKPVGSAHHEAVKAGNLYLAGTEDLPGAGIQAMRRWKDVIDATKSDEKGLCLYFVDAVRVEGDTVIRSQVEEHIDLLSGWLDGRPYSKSPAFVVIATHADQIPGWESAHGEERARLVDEFKASPAVKKLAGVPNHRDTLLVSFKSEETTKAAIQALCETLTRAAK